MRGRVIVYRLLIEVLKPRTGHRIRRFTVVWVFWYLLQIRRIRLAAYGARLERVLG